MPSFSKKKEEKKRRKTSGGPSDIDVTYGMLYWPVKHESPGEGGRRGSDWEYYWTRVTSTRGIIPSLLLLLLLVVVVVVLVIFLSKPAKTRRKSLNFAAFRYLKFQFCSFLFYFYFIIETVNR